MRNPIFWLCLALTLCLLPGVCLAESADSLGVYVLEPLACPASDEAETTDLYLGPTQGSYRPDDLTIDLSAPYVYFGQHDCWAMVASGTPEDMGPIGWVEAAAADFPAQPQLSFEDALPVMVEEDATLIASPAAEEPLCTLARGTQVLLLAQLGDWGYVQAEIDSVPVRALLPLNAIL